LVFQTNKLKGQIGSWKEKVSEIPEFVIAFSSAAVDGQILLIGGYIPVENNTQYSRIYGGVLVYNVQHNSWSRKYSDLPHPRGHLSCELWGKEIFVVGGLGDMNHHFIENRVDVLHTESGEWSLGIPIEISSRNITGRYGFASCISGDELFIIGGTFDVGSSTNDLQKFNMRSKIWSQLAPVPIPIANSTAVLIDKTIYLFGGTPDHWDLPIQTVFKYDIETNSWSENSSMLPIKLSRVAACSFDGIIYVFGGQKSPIKSYKQKETSSAVFLFDPQTNYWQEVSSMYTGLSSMTAHGLDGNIYLMGGVDANSQTIGSLSANTPSVSIYTPVKAPIYSLKTHLSKYSLQSRNDSCLILSNIINHHKHNVVITAQLKGQASGKIIELQLFDDGEHDDGAAGDGYYGNYFKHLGFEDLFQVRIVSHNHDLNEQFISGQDCRSIATFGPVAVAGISITKSEVAINNDLLLSFSLELKNSGQVINTDELTVDLFSNIDEIEILKKTSACPLIYPGMTATCKTEFKLRVSSGYPISTLSVIQVSISSRGHSFWNDTIEIPQNEK
jgi:N-acetylneuraminic acid mutarotase